jgi:transposase
VNFSRDFCIDWRYNVGMSMNRPSESRLRVPDRSQVVMEARSPDELVDADHPVRLIWRVVCELDLSLFYEPIKALEGEVGRDTTDPRLLVALWLYGATDGIGSARELARLCTTSHPFIWLCGGVSLNHHTLSDFRVGHGDALDELFTQVLASLVQKKVIRVYRISQDGTRVRACCGASSLRRKERLNVLFKQARAHVKELKDLLKDPERSAGLAAKKKAAMTRAAREREQRIAQAIAQLPELEARQQELARRKSTKEKARLKEPRASTTDAEARVMKMADGGFRPALNVQIASDTSSRAIVGVEVINAGVDTEQLEPMRRQVQKRTKQVVHEQLADGGYLTFDDIDHAAEQNVTLYVPPKPPRDPEKYGDSFTPRPTDSDAVKEWRERMGGDEAKEIYKQRAATSETINADLKTHRGLMQLTVRGIAKAKCVALWCALAYNLMHFGVHLLG